MCSSDLDIPKKYSTKSLGTVPALISPNATIGAATSPKLKASLVDVKVYVGLKALELIWRASLLLASILASSTGSVQ